MAGKLRVLERGSNMVLAEHYTPVHGSRITTIDSQNATRSKKNITSLYAPTKPVDRFVQPARYMQPLKEQFGFVGEFAANFRKI